MEMQGHSNNQNSLEEEQHWIMLQDIIYNNSDQHNRIGTRY